MVLSTIVSKIAGPAIIVLVVLLGVSSGVIYYLKGEVDERDAAIVQLEKNVATEKANVITAKNAQEAQRLEMRKLEFRIMEDQARMHELDEKYRAVSSEYEEARATYDSFRDRLGGLAFKNPTLVARLGGNALHENMRNIEEATTYGNE